MFDEMAESLHFSAAYNANTKQSYYLVISDKGGEKMRKLKRLVYGSAACILASSLTLTSVMAADTFEGWDEENRSDAWEVYANTEWTQIQDRLILNQLTGSASADVSALVRAYENLVRDVLEDLDGGVYGSEAYVELMLAMMQVLSVGVPVGDDPCNVKVWFDPTAEDMTARESIEYVARRLFAAERAHQEHDSFASPYKCDNALLSVVQGVMLGTRYTRENEEYSVSNSMAYYNANRSDYEEGGLTPNIEFAKTIGEIYHTVSLGDYGSGVLRNPCPAATISSEFGGRASPGGIGSTNHKGRDYAAPSGTSIYAAASGTVTQVSTSSARGKYCIIDHGNNMSTLYQHCSAILVQTGQTVSAGQEIAKVGNTGNSTGPHLHFEVHINGEPVDPRLYLQ